MILIFLTRPSSTEPRSSNSGKSEDTGQRREDSFEKVLLVFLLKAHRTVTICAQVGPIMSIDEPWLVSTQPDPGWAPARPLVVWPGN